MVLTHKVLAAVARTLRRQIHLRQDSRRHFGLSGRKLQTTVSLSRGTSHLANLNKAEVLVHLLVETSHSDFSL